MAEAKADIKARYLKGESIGSIAKTLDIAKRTVYYHLGVMTAQQRQTHLDNLSVTLHNHVKRIKVKTKSESEQDSLADFV